MIAGADGNVPRDADGLYLAIARSGALMAGIVGDGLESAFSLTDPPDAKARQKGKKGGGSVALGGGFLLVWLLSFRGRLVGCNVGLGGKVLNAYLPRVGG